jgi:hypothetical protein
VIEEFARSLPGIEILGMAGLLLSFFFFCAVVFWTWRLDKDHVHRMAGLPLDADHSDITDSKD